MFSRLALYSVPVSLSLKQAKLLVGNISGYSHSSLLSILITSESGFEPTCDSRSRANSVVSREMYSKYT